ncbi:MAG: tRNA pseudouridine(38-40) synthase TruA [Treponema sp.]|nr:tRNA pseudouridine(38-40) synthase TruA [Treponema sp.]
MRNILLTISYDGSDFCGWQRQDDVDGGQAFRTVQGEVEKALFKLHKKETPLYGSGRTDSGVHALGQAANFYSPVDSMPAENYIRALNAFLPADVRITAACEVPEDFSARKNATSRVYRYFISFGDSVPANNFRYSWYVKNYQPDIERLNQLSACLRGELDCSSFCASGDQSLSMNRYIDDAHFFIQKDIWGKELLVFQIEANAFLWKMVRTLTGTIVNLDKSKALSDALEKILKAKDRNQAGVTAPPTGLFLYEIKFDGIRRHE